jgi:hypothetical protein
MEYNHAGMLARAMMGVALLLQKGARGFIKIKIYSSYCLRKIGQYKTNGNSACMHVFL